MSQPAIKGGEPICFSLTKLWAGDLGFLEPLLNLVLYAQLWIRSILVEHKEYGGIPRSTNVGILQSSLRLIAIATVRVQPGAIFTYPHMI